MEIRASNLELQTLICYDTGLTRVWAPQARLLFHEAATPEAADGGALPAARRVQLLRDALAHARTATELAPASLSCAALRATLLANLLVENSTAIGGISAGGAAAGPGASEALVAEMQQQLREGVDACGRVLALQQPLPSEPIIFIATGHLKTIDPCCLVRSPPGSLKTLKP